MRIVALAACLAVALVLPQFGRADHLVVGRGTAIRAEPRRNAARVSTAEAGTTLRLLATELENGYYQVVDPSSGGRAWIYKTFVRRYPDESTALAPLGLSSSTSVDCSAKKPLRVHFYDVGQALSALVDLPDGRHILVDAGESPTRAGCGTVCRLKHEHLLERLQSDLNGGTISMVWITHQHSDHVGGAAGVLEKFRIEVYADNGQDLAKRQVSNARALAAARGAEIVTIDPEHSRTPIEGSGTALKIRSVLPASWPVDCGEDPNSCSIGLRIDYCSSSVLFTGDAEYVEESGLEPYGHITLLQVGHHGSDTSSSTDFLAVVSPKYAVISAGRKGEGLNSTYCHPREVTVNALTTILGSRDATAVTAFDGAVNCRTAPDSHWHTVRGSDRLWVTARDGDVTLVTTGDGVFARE